ncbi:hypothetical protein GGQ80_000778 [Sphingomonas jinjuensis]|uniref:Uncharacterized protein n=1 Tax=Sphingomonas jinjuensis TaxID=535907 RepID=A0A840F4S8_9SPHN|nr:hypothetical protein [Sphingomonas jinjuensis]MBB4152890.1 hypothetical protein [Sphingomonas jinjuensis]
MADLVRKQGDTLLAYLVVRDAVTGDVVDLSALGIVVTSDARDADGIVHSFAVTPATLGGGAAQRLRASLGGWAIGAAAWDVQLDEGDERTSTDTQRIQIVEDVTQ